MTKKRKKDNIDLICEELMKYNEEHGTSYSYGEYTALVGMGKIKSKYRTKETLTCRSCKECRGYKFCASRSRDYPCLCFINKDT